MSEEVTFPSASEIMEHLGANTRFVDFDPDFRRFCQRLSKWGGKSVGSKEVIDLVLWPTLSRVLPNFDKKGLMIHPVHHKFGEVIKVLVEDEEVRKVVLAYQQEKIEWFNRFNQ